jgi:hypothetical protein
VQAYYSIAGRDLEREIVPMMADQKADLSDRLANDFF